MPLVKNNNTIQEVLKKGSAGLIGPSKRLDAELILSHVLGCDRAYLYSHYEQTLTTQKIKQFNTLADKQKQGMPIAYILKKKEFYGREFYIEPGVFIPRPETETIVSAVLAHCQQNQLIAPYIIDLGCGSGCVGLSLLAHLTQARLLGIDVCLKALRVSQTNALKHKLSHRASFLQADLPWGEQKWGPADIVVANPPYIAFNDHRISKETLLFEPAKALFSGENGLKHIRVFLKVAYMWLNPGGAYFFEIGANQDIAPVQLEIKNCMQKVASFKDLFGYTRVLKYRRLK